MNRKRERGERVRPGGVRYAPTLAGTGSRNAKLLVSSLPLKPGNVHNKTCVGGSAAGRGQHDAGLVVQVRRAIKATPHAELRISVARAPKLGSIGRSSWAHFFFSLFHHVRKPLFVFVSCMVLLGGGCCVRSAM